MSRLMRCTNTRPPYPTDDQLARATILRISLCLERELDPLTTANKHRVMLAISDQIAVTLEALGTATDS